MATRGKGPRPPAAPIDAGAALAAPPPATGALPASSAGYAPALNAGFQATTDSVQQMHTAIAGTAFEALLRVPGLALPTRIVQGVHDAIAHGVYAAVRHGGGAALSAAGGAERLAAKTGRAPGTKEQAVRSALNGVFGDALAASNNPLSIHMGLHAHGKPVALTAAALARLLPRVVLFIHGLACDERSWEGRPGAWEGSAWVGLLPPSPTNESCQYGALLEHELPVSSLYLRYNTGLAIDANAESLARLLVQLVAAAPQVQDIVLIGHSMGGLVARRAHDMAMAAGMVWPCLGDGAGPGAPVLICLGSPHEGAPLEQLGALAAAALGLTDTTRPLARIADARSAGIKGLRRGIQAQRGATVSTVPTVPTVQPVALKLVFGSLGDEGDATAMGALIARVLGDGLVQPPSAAASQLEGDVERCAVPGLGHMALLSHPRVYALIRHWLGAPAGLLPRSPVAV
jgi:pimeloyl-ACP methyl ester carboxylesterase